MNAIPHRKPDARRESSGRNAPLVDALVSQAEARAEMQQREKRIAEARDREADEFVFTWQTEDEREAEFCIYYSAHADVEILATELLQLEGREATLQERLRCEQDFEGQLASEGELWSQVESHLWERSLSQ
jgi:hypothetical protein